MRDLLIAAVTVVGVPMAAAWVYCVTRSLVDRTDFGHDWGASFDDFYAHPDSQSGPAARVRPGPRPDPTEDLTCATVPRSS